MTKNSFFLVFYQKNMQLCQKNVYGYHIFIYLATKMKNKTSQIVT